MNPPAIPMRTIALDRAVTGAGAPAAKSRCLAVLLPGRWDEPERFREAGFARAVAERDLDVDLVAVDSHLGYFRDRSIVERLRLDVIAPAKASGYDTIWIVGTSLGGLGGLLYLRDHPEDLSGVLALAPYLGESELIGEIEAAGGARKWTPPASYAATDIGRELWSWLTPWLAGPQSVPLHIGWGSQDKLGRSNRLVADALPTAEVYNVAGGHDWKTWEELWEAFLDRTPICRRAR
ncbi:MAG: alpha/beta hydrolase-fold protein [Thermoanaerobaculia bacterium]